MVLAKQQPKRTRTQGTIELQTTHRFDQSSERREEFDAGFDAIAEVVDIFGPLHFVLSGQDTLKFRVTFDCDPNADPEGGAIFLGDDEIVGIPQEPLQHVRRQPAATSEFAPIYPP